MEEHAPFDPIPGRKTPAKGVKVTLGGPNIVLLTVCAADRRTWMAQREVQQSLETIWREADAWLVGYYLLMPDHLHLFCAPRDLRFTLEKWMAYWKSQFTRKHLIEGWEWQRGGFHHRLRHARSFQEKWAYVRENPLRKGLVNRAEDWPFCGIVHEWHW
jgi:putative transposase